MHSVRPRYVKGKLPTRQPKASASCVALSMLILMGTRYYFPQLTLNPVDSEKNCRIFFTVNFIDLYSSR